ncbi:Phenylalanine--tRNA ligase beta subunit [subsurface metagenome]
MPGAAAAVLTSDKTVGCVGELSQGLIDTGKVLFRPFAFELDLAALEPHFLQAPSAQPMARTPAVTRDLAVVVRVKEAFARIEEEIRRSAGPSLEALRLVDQYQGPQVPPDHQSLAFRLVFRDPSRTLTTEYVSEVMDGIIKSLSHRFGAQLRK